MEFDDVRDAEDAIHEMNGERLCGDRITVELAKGTVAELQYGLSSLVNKVIKIFNRWRRRSRSLALTLSRPELALGHASLRARASSSDSLRRDGRQSVLPLHVSPDSAKSKRKIGNLLKS